MNNISKIIIRCVLGLFVILGFVYTLSICIFELDDNAYIVFLRTIPDYLAMPFFLFGFFSFVAIVILIIGGIVIFIVEPISDWIFSPLKKKKNKSNVEHCSDPTCSQMGRKIESAVGDCPNKGK